MTKARGPGRPKRIAANLKRRQELIEIAAKQIADRGYEAVSLKDIASEAEITPAMISYYFGGKAGLMRAVMEYAIHLMAQNSEAILRDSEEAGLAEAFTQNHMRFMSENEWIVHLFTREILGKNSESRQIFMDDFVAKSLRLLSPKISEDQSKGILKKDLNPDFTRLSLAGMCIFPFLVAPVLGTFYGYTTDRKFVEDYGKHVNDLFMKGAGPR